LRPPQNVMSKIWFPGEDKRQLKKRWAAGTRALKKLPR
jgi:hypothetical protein